MASQAESPDIVENSAAFGETAWTGYGGSALTAGTVAQVSIVDPDMAAVPFSGWSSWRTPAALTEGISGTTAWTNPTNAATQDGNRATCSTTSTSTYLQAQDFGFSAEIPAGATINAVEVRFYRDKTGTDITNLLDVQIMNGPSNNVSSLKGDPDTTTAYSGFFSGVAGYGSFGGTGDTWGGYLSSLTDSVIRSANFGVALKAQVIFAGSGAVPRVDSMEIRVNWTGSTIPEGTSNYLILRDFDFAVASNQKINGIKLEFKRFATNGFPEVIKDQVIQLWNGSTVIGTSKSLAATWPSTTETKTFGGDGDVWGANLTYSDVNAAGFGFAIAVKYINDTSTTGGPLVAYLTTGLTECVATVYYADSAGYADTLTPTETIITNRVTVSDTLVPVEDFINKRFDELLVPVETFSYIIVYSVTVPDESVVLYESFQAALARLDGGAEILAPTETFAGAIPRLDEIMSLVETFTVNSPVKVTVAEVMAMIENYLDQHTWSAVFPEYLDPLETLSTTGTVQQNPKPGNDALSPTEGFGRAGSSFGRTVADLFVSSEGFVAWVPNKHTFSPG